MSRGPPEWVLLDELVDWIACRCSLDKSEVERRLPAAMMAVWPDPTNFRLRTQLALSGITRWLPLEVERTAGTATVRVRRLLARSDGDESGYGWAVLASMLGLDLSDERELRAQHGRRYLLEVDGHAVLTEVLRQPPQRTSQPEPEKPADIATAAPERQLTPTEMADAFAANYPGKGQRWLWTEWHTDDTRPHIGLATFPKKERGRPRRKSTA